MATIEQLPAAVAVADGDLLAVQQGGTTRHASRAQLLAGTQAQLALGAGELLGRASSGSGAPEPIRLGNALVMQSGTLAAVTTPLDVPNLPAGAPPGAADLVPFAQAGRNVATSYQQFMGAMVGVPGLDGSSIGVAVAGGTTRRPLADIAGDAVPVEAFGAVGDGVTDDSAAIARAVASGRPVRFGPRTYVVNGQFTIARDGVTFLGTQGATTLRRAAQAGNGAWIAIQGANFRAEDIVFDANGGAVAVESWGVLVAASCLRSDFHRCAFRNACGTSLGSGLVFLASDPAIGEHVVRDCAFSGNAVHGLWVQACRGVLVAECRAHDNGQYGIVVDYNDAAFARQARLAQVLGNRCWANRRGISIGNFNASNGQPPVWGNANPDVIGALVASNICHDNSIYGIAVSGRAILVAGNLLSNNGTGTTGGAGILANCAGCRVADNMITGTATYGIDSGGSADLALAGNMISGGLYGINAGGGQRVRLTGNGIQGASIAAICVADVEADGNGVNFGQATAAMLIEGNWIGVDGAAAGIWLRDGPRGVQVLGNQFVGTGAIENCLWADTDAVRVARNLVNGADEAAVTPAMAGGRLQLVVPDIIDRVAIPAASGPIQSIIPARQAQAAGGLLFVRVTNGGTGYSTASITIGGAGSGASAVAIIRDGIVIGARVTAPGTGYGGIGTNVPVTITGDGTGATATAVAGLPLPEGRALAVRCAGRTTFQTAGALPPQGGPDGTDVIVPAGAAARFTVRAGAWFAEGPAVAALAGHGSPEGAVAAPPGSDWRNLDGGAGTTWWIKRSGTGPTGWFAVA